MRTLCLYTFHQYNPNVEFFIREGLFMSDQIDFYFVINDLIFRPTLPSYCRVKNRVNQGHDFGAWSEALLEGNPPLWRNYDYFIFINSSCRGPFLPIWIERSYWPQIFISRLQADIHLVGSTICRFNGQPHVQSYMFAADRLAITKAIENGIFSSALLSRDETVWQREIGFSTLLLKEGWNIACLLKAYQGVDFRVAKRGTICFYASESYFGINPHPYEVIFSKIPGDKRQAGNNQRLVDLYTHWSSPHNIVEPVGFDWLSYLLLNPDLIEAGITTSELASLHYRQHATSEARISEIGQEKRHYFRYSGHGIAAALIFAHYAERDLIVVGYRAWAELNIKVAGKLKSRIWADVSGSIWQSVTVQGDLVRTLYLLRKEKTAYLELSQDYVSLIMAEPGLARMVAQINALI